MSNFELISEKEGVAITKEALALIAVTADGSVRDGQSLLDQVISTGMQESQELDSEKVRQILGLASRSQSYDLMEFIMSGEVAKALDLLEHEYTHGNDPVLILKDLLELIHLIVRTKVTPQLANKEFLSEKEIKRGKDLGE